MTDATPPRGREAYTDILCSQLSLSDRVEIETAEPIWLTQDISEAAEGRRIIVDGTRDLIVYGDIVIVHGTLSLPGRNVLIFAREVRPRSVATGATSAQSAGINVDGLPGTDNSNKDHDPKVLPQTGAGTPAAKPKNYYDNNPAKAGQGQRGATGAPGDSGGEGHPGGSIFIGCMLIDAPLVLSAKGGKGGDGQPGQNGGQGGNGGDGCLYSQSGGFTGVITMEIGRVGGPAGQGGDGGPGGKGGSGGIGGAVVVRIAGSQPEQAQPGRLGQEINLLAKYLGGPIMTAGGPGQSALGGKAGPPGNTGVDRHNAPGLDETEKDRAAPTDTTPPVDRSSVRAGANTDKVSGGRASCRWNCNVGELFSYPGDPKLPHEDKFRSSVTYARMLFDRSCAVLLAIDKSRAAGDQNLNSTLTDALARLDWIITALNKSSASAPEAATQQRLAAAVQTTKANLAFNDFFGNAADWVPLEPLAIHVGKFKESLAELQKFEKTFIKFWQAQRDATVVTDTLGAAAKKAQSAAADLEEPIKQTRADTKATLDLISDTQVSCLAAKQKLETAIASFKDHVSTASGLSLQGMLNGLQQMAFFPVSPAPGHENPVGQASMVLGQAGQLLYDNVTKVVNDSGEPVSKEYVLGKLRLIGKKLTRSDYESNPDGTLKVDPADTKTLLLTQEALAELVNDFHKSVKGAREAEEDMDAYVKAVGDRNSLILQYNASLAALGKLLSAQDLAKSDGAAANKGLSDQSQPSLEARAAVMAAVYDRCRNACIEHLYKASRAFYCWTLEPYNALYSEFELSSPESFDRLDYTVLSAADADFMEQQFNQLEINSTHEPESFPAYDDGPGASGVMVEFTREQHPDVFGSLQTNGCARLSLRPAFFGEVHHPFAGWANIRITKARAWMVGMTTSNIAHKVTLTHGATDEFVIVDDTSYTLTHRTKDITFQYRGDNLEANYVPGVGFKDATARLTEGGTSDGDIFKPSPAALALAGKHSNAKAWVSPLGPFTTWDVSVDLAGNEGRDFSNCNLIVLEFHGYRQSFPRFPVPRWTALNFRTWMVSSASWLPLTDSSRRVLFSVQPDGTLRAQTAADAETIRWELLREGGGGQACANDASVQGLEHMTSLAIMRLKSQLFVIYIPKVRRFRPGPNTDEAVNPTVTIAELEQGDVARLGYEQRGGWRAGIIDTLGTPQPTARGMGFPDADWDKNLNLKALAAVSDDATGRYELLGIDENGELYRSQYDQQASPTFSRFTRIGGWLSSWCVAAALNADGRLEVFALDKNGLPVHIVETSPRGDWSPWRSLGGQQSSFIATVSDSEGRLQVFCADNDGQAYLCQQVSPGKWV